MEFYGSIEEKYGKDIKLVVKAEKDEESAGSVTDTVEVFQVKIQKPKNRVFGRDFVDKGDGEDSD